MQYILKYDQYFLKESFEFDILKSFIGISAASLLGILICIFINQLKTKLGKNIVSKFDPVIGNKFDQYSKQIDSKISKKELVDLFKTFYNDNVLKGYITKINKTSNQDEKKYLQEQADDYIKSKLKPEQLKALNNISFRGEGNYNVHPLNVKEFNETMKIFLTDFNTYLSKKDLLPVEHFDIVGSSFYWKDDIKNDPHKKYGDIDCILTYPLMNFGEGVKSKNSDEEKTLNMYKGLVLNFVEETKPSYIDNELMYNLNRSKLNKKLFTGISLPIFMKDNVILNVDLLHTFSPYREWSVTRLLPQKEYKGSIFGFLYHAIEESLLISITNTGVQAWLTPKSNKLKGKSETGTKLIQNISNNPKTFFIDIAEFLMNVTNTKNYKIDNLLNQNTGFNDKNNINLETVIKGLRGLINTIDQNGLFKLNLFSSEVYDLKSCLEKIRSVYTYDLMKSINNSKYNNITDPSIIADYERMKSSATYAHNLSKKWLS